MSEGAAGVRAGCLRVACAGGEGGGEDRRVKGEGREEEGGKLSV